MATPTPSSSTPLTRTEKAAKIRAVVDECYEKGVRTGAGKDAHGNLLSEVYKLDRSAGVVLTVEVEYAAGEPVTVRLQEISTSYLYPN